MELENLAQANRQNPSLVNSKLMRILCNVEILKAAYGEIKSNQGNMTPGVDGETLDGIDDEWFKKTVTELETGTFRWRPARRVEIPKPKGGTRPLSVASPRDKIVQKAIQMILEAIYESSFLEASHGFRPGRGCHTALRTIKNTFTGVN